MSKARSYERWLKNYILHKYGFILESKREERYIPDWGLVREVNLKFPKGVSYRISFRGDKAQYFFADLEISESERDRLIEILKEADNNILLDIKTKKGIRKRLRKLSRENGVAESEVACEIKRLGSPPEILYNDLTKYIILPIYRAIAKG